MKNKLYIMFLATAMINSYGGNCSSSQEKTSVKVYNEPQKDISEAMNADAENFSSSETNFTRYHSCIVEQDISEIDFSNKKALDILSSLGTLNEKVGYFNYLLSVAEKNNKENEENKSKKTLIEFETIKTKTEESIARLNKSLLKYFEKKEEMQGLIADKILEIDFSEMGDEDLGKYLNLLNKFNYFTGKFSKEEETNEPGENQYDKRLPQLLEKIFVIQKLMSEKLLKIDIANITYANRVYYLELFYDVISSLRNKKQKISDEEEKENKEKIVQLHEKKGLILENLARSYEKLTDANKDSDEANQDFANITSLFKDACTSYYLANNKNKEAEILQCLIEMYEAKIETKAEEKDIDYIINCMNTKLKLISCKENSSEEQAQLKDKIKKFQDIKTELKQ